MVLIFKIILVVSKALGLDISLKELLQTSWCTSALINEKGLRIQCLIIFYTN